MQQKSFGKLPPVSVLTLGGGGLGMVWGETTFEECVATVLQRVYSGNSSIGCSAHQTRAPVTEPSCVKSALIKRRF